MTNERPGPPRGVDGITFIGTATTVIRLGAFTVLTDPNFLRRGQRAYLGYGLWSRRLTDPACGVEDLPPLSAVVLSHLHGDHWDRVTERALDRSVPVLTTPHAAERLQRKGFRTHGLGTWRSTTLAAGDERLTVEALPAVHARGVLGALLPPVMGSLVTHVAGGHVLRRVYVSGDTLTGPHLDEIARRHPEVDVAVVHLGGTRVLAHSASLDGGGGVDLLRRLRPATAVPVHHGDYGVFRSPLVDFTVAATSAGLADVVRVAPRGGTVELPPVPVAAHDPLAQNASRSIGDA
jgi:L-ascorbate metabolism protein UlaG (beta-lactamase superfamily)